MNHPPLRATGLLLLAALTLGWERPALAQPTAIPQGAISSADADLPWSGSGGGVVSRSGSLLRFNFVGGQGVGYDSSYLTLGVFQPFWKADESLWYFDAQGLLIGRTFDEREGLSGGANVGVGYRAPNPWNCDSIWGAYLFYDYSDVYRNAYNQIGAGIESLGETWDFRGNFYFPLDKTSNLVSLSPMMGPFYRDYNMIFEQTEVTERSFWGFDAEVGRRLHGHPDGMNFRGYLGTYYYENWDIEGPQFWGIYGRVQAHLLPDLWANVTVSHDEQFETTASVQVTWLFPVCGRRTACVGGPVGCAPCDVPCSPCSPGRYLEPVRRNPNVVVRDVTRTIETIATDPLTGLPISILHVDSNAPPGGDGTFENPFNTLAATEAEAFAGDYDIILGHSGSVFTGEQITLPDDIRFLGEGIDHLVDTEQAGTIVLPPANGGTDVPIIDMAPGNAVTVASNTEVSGFTITDPGAAGIFANGVTGPVDINRNTIEGGVNGINILNSTGTFDVTQTTIDGTTGTAFNINGGAPNVNSSADITNSLGRIIAVQNTTGGVVNFVGGTLLDDGGEGILVSNAAGAVNIDGATLNNSLANAVDILNSSGPIDLTNIAINSPAGTGVNILNSNAQISNFTIETPGISGIVVTSLNTNRTVELTNNTINGAGATGIELNVNGTGRLTADVVGNTISSLGNAFDAATSGAGGPLVLAFDNNTLTSTGAAGAFITGAAGGPVTITDFLNNVVVDAPLGGILVESATFDASTTVAGIQAVNGGVSTIGAIGNRVGGDGLRLNNVAGSLSYTNLEIFNENGTGLLVNGAGVGPNAFRLATSNGKLDTDGGPAMNVRDVTLASTFASVLSVDSNTNGLVIDTAAGTFKSSSTTVDESRLTGLLVQNSPNLVADFGATTITGTGVDPTDVGAGVELLNNPGAQFTFATLDVNTDYGAGFVAIDSGTVNLLVPGNVTANGGPVLNIDSTAGRTNGVPGWTFNSLVSTNSLTEGLRLIDLPDPLVVTGPTTIDNATGPSIEIGGTTAATFAATTITNRNDVGILLHDTSRNVTFGATTISGAGGGTAGVEMRDSTGGAVTLAQLTINNSGGQGVLLDNNAGSFNVTGPTTIFQPQGTAIEINGGTGGASFGTVAVNNRFGAGIDISGGNQTITIGATTINNPNNATGTVLNVDNTAGGRVTVASLNANLNNVVGDGVTLVSNSAIVEVLGGAITNSAGRSLLIDGGDEDVTFAASISNSAGRSVEIHDRSDGIVNLNGAITSVGSANGILIDGSTGPNTINFNAKTTLGTSVNRLTGGTGLFIDGNGTAPDTAIVNFTNLDVFTDGRIGVEAVNGGTLNIATGRINTTGAGATGLIYDGIDTDTKLASINVDNIGAGDDAVVLRDLAGDFQVLGATTLGQTGTIGRGVVIEGGDATIAFSTVNVANRADDGVSIRDTEGTITLGATTISGAATPADAGVRIRDTVAGSVTLASLNVSGTAGRGLALANNAANIVVSGPTTVAGSSTTGIEIVNGTGNVTLGTVNVTNSAGTGLGVNNLTGLLTINGGNVTNSNGTAVDIRDSLLNVTLGNVTATNGSAINLDTNQGAFNVTGTVTQNNGTGSSVRVVDGNTAVTLANLNLNNTAGIGVDVNNSSGLFRVNGGTVSNTNGPAIQIFDTTIDVTLATVNSSNGTNGIRLENTPGRFVVTSGGTIQNAVDGVLLWQTENVTLNNLLIVNSSAYGVRSIDSSNLTLNSLQINGSAFIGLRTDNTNTIAANNLTINSGGTAFGAVFLDSTNVAVSGGTYNSGIVGIYAIDSNSGSITGATVNSVVTGTGIVLNGSDDFVVRSNTLNTGVIGLQVVASGENIDVTIEANRINNYTVSDVDIIADTGSVALISGPHTTPPNAAVNNVTTHLGAEYTDDGGTITGQVQINGTTYP